MKELGAVSISLAVKNIEDSRLFYEKLGFEIFAGEQSQNWLILKNGDHTIGLFQGMFDENILTFNPGWDQDGNTLDSYTDVRVLLEDFKSKGIEPGSESIEGDSGPSSFTIANSDGNSILIDQHI